MVIHPSICSSYGKGRCYCFGPIIATAGRYTATAERVLGTHRCKQHGARTVKAPCTIPAFAFPCYLMHCTISKQLLAPYQQQQSEGSVGHTQARQGSVALLSQTPSMDPQGCYRMILTMGTCCDWTKSLAGFILQASLVLCWHFICPEEGNEAQSISDAWIPEEKAW